MSDLNEVLGSNFREDDYKPDEFSIIPPGDYPVLIEKAELKMTKAQDGMYVEFQLKIKDGPFMGRKLWDRMNIKNKSPEAEAIGRKALVSIGKATDTPVNQSSTMFLNKECIAHVKVDKNNQNAIRGYSKIGSDQPPIAPNYVPPQAQSQGPYNPPPPTVAKKFPWEK